MAKMNTSHVSGRVWGGLADGHMHASGAMHCGSSTSNSITADVSMIGCGRTEGNYLIIPRFAMPSHMHWIRAALPGRPSTGRWKDKRAGGAAASAFQLSSCLGAYVLLLVASCLQLLRLSDSHGLSNRAASRGRVSVAGATI